MKHRTNSPQHTEYVQMTWNTYWLSVLLALCTVFWVSSATQANQWTEKLYAGRTAEKADDLKKAEKFYLAALDDAEASGEAAAFIALRSLGDLYLKTKELDRAEPLFLRQLKIADGLVFNKRDSYNLEDKSHTLWALAEIARMRGHLREQEVYLRRTLPLFEIFYGPNSQRVADTLGQIALSCSKRKNFDSALVATERALAIHQKLDPGSALVGNDLDTLSGLYSDKQQFAQSERYAKASMAVRRRLFKANHPACVKATLSLAIVYSHEHKFDQALPLFREVQRMAPIAYGPNSFTANQMMVSFANAYGEQEMWAEAIPLYEKASVNLRKILSPADSTLISYSRNLINSYLKVGDKGRARRLCQSVLDGALSVDKPNQTIIEILRKDLAACQ